MPAGDARVPNPRRDMGAGHRNAAFDGVAAAGCRAATCSETSNRGRLERHTAARKACRFGVSIGRVGCGGQGQTGYLERPS